jgi:hypothetical protein
MVYAVDAGVPTMEAVSGAAVITLVAGLLKNDTL